MALRDLKSDLTNLKFGKGKAYDQPGMGFSNQPFIKNSIFDFGEGGFVTTIDTLTDGLVRGGIVTATERSLQDVERITKFLLTPQGLGFLSKQVGLQASNPVIREGGNIFKGPASNQRTYNLGLSTLASVGTSAAGIRFKREGLLPKSDPNNFDGYVTDIELTKENSSENRLIKLFKNHITLEEEAPNANLLFEYKGGPGSIYGLGQTTINKYETTFQDPERQDIGGVSGGENFTLPHEPLNTKKQTRKYNKGISSYHVSMGGYDGIDVRNLQSVLQNQSEVDQEYLQTEDFIPFRFEAVNTDKPQLSDFILFRAFLDSFNDNYNASHNEYNYNGRGETFYTYNNFKRSIDFSFKIAAQTKGEMQPLYEKLNYLVSNTAPEYSSTGRIRTPFIKLTVGDWCNRTPGILNSVGLSWQKDYPWEIRNNDGVLMLPHVLDVSVQFTPIHNFMPEKSMNSHFISVKPKTTTNSNTPPASNVVNQELLDTAPSIETPSLLSSTPRLPGYFASKTTTLPPTPNNTDQAISLNDSNLIGGFS